METKYLATLVTIVETGSFQKAAVHLNYAPSTVTAQIKQLEEEFGFPLFERVGRKMELTQAGRDIMPFVQSILQNAEKITSYNKSPSQLTGTLRLAAPDSIFIYVMQPIIKAILHEAPHIQLVIHSVPSDDINQAIVSGAADIGIDCDKGRFPESVLHPASRPFQACLIGSPFMPPAERDFLSPHQRKPFSMICNEPNANYQKAIEAYFDRKDILLNPPNHFGIAYVPLFSVKEELQDGSLIRLETELDAQFFPAVCVYHRNKWISPQMQLTFRILHKQLGIVFDGKENAEI